MVCTKREITIQPGEDVETAWAINSRGRSRLIYIRDSSASGWMSTGLGDSEWLPPLVGTAVGVACVAGAMAWLGIDGLPLVGVFACGLFGAGLIAKFTQEFVAAQVMAGRVSEAADHQRFVLTGRGPQTV